jgi:hypothetical protein
MSQIPRSIPRLAIASVAAGAIFFSLAGMAIASRATVTAGSFASFAAGTGLQIDGRAQMVRTAAGTTIVTVHVKGLAPNTAYGSHVHKQACADGEADGHYRFDPAGPAAPPNEIWPAFTTNAAGIGNGIAIVDGIAGATAVSVVVHAPGGAKIACADLG